MLPIINKLKNHKGSILIFTHENPDADGIGSMLALYRFLKKKGKNVDVAMKDDLPYVLNFLPDSDKIKKLPTNKKYDLGIIVDAAGKFRAGVDVDAKEFIRIDHHIGGEFYGGFDCVDTTAPSTTYVVANILRDWDEEAIDKDIATNLYTGLITDTGSFRHNNVDERSFELAEYLVRKGVDPAYVARMVFERNKPNVIHLLQRSLSTLKTYDEGKIAGMVVERSFLNETGTKEEDTEGFVNYPRSIDGVDVAFLMIQREDPEMWRVSLRGKGDIDVRQIASAFGGGGHRDAAGCRIKGTKEEVENKLVNKIKEEIKKQKGVNV